MIALLELNMISHFKFVNFFWYIFILIGGMMLPFEQFPQSVKSAIKFVLTDIDDTLTTQGRLPWCVFEAMERLQANSIHVIPVTGRPAGWCDHIARMWPVDGGIGENGAFYFRYDPVAKK